MKLSIVTTLYKSAPYIQEFYERTCTVAEQLVEDDYEIVFVNDGSPDNSLEIVAELAEQDEHIVVIDLSRNFGHHKAMMTGLQYATGERIFLIDSDLEEEPEWLINFTKHLEQENSDVVYGVQEKRKGGWFERWSGEVYYSLMNKITGIGHPRNIVTARLMTKNYVQALLLHNEKDIIISYLWLITGFNQCELRVIKLSLVPTTYSFMSRLSIAVNTIVAFSSKPLEFVFYSGLSIAILSFITGVYLLINRIFFASTLSGWTSVMVTLWFLGGITILVLGIIGIYINKIYIEVKQRPRSIVRKIYAKK